LQLVVSGPAGGTTDGDAKTIQIVAPTIASAANQVFAVGQPATAMAAITVTDAATPTITKAKGIRVRIPATFNMTWNTALMTAANATRVRIPDRFNMSWNTALTAPTITGSGAGKVSPTVSYEDAGKTLVLNVTTNFAGNDQIVVSGLQYMSFTAPSAAGYLQLAVSGSGSGAASSDSRTITIVQPTIASAANQLFVVGQ